MINEELARHNHRRTFLKRSSYGIGAAALNAMLSSEQRAVSQNTGDAALNWNGIYPVDPKQQKIKRVIHLCMAGGPSHLETLDYKPKLAEMDGQPMPKSYTEGKQIAQLQGQADRLNAWHRNMSSRNSESRVSKSAVSCRRSGVSPMTSVSSVPCRRIRSITTLLIHS